MTRTPALEGQRSNVIGGCQRSIGAASSLTFLRRSRWMTASRRRILRRISSPMSRAVLRPSRHSRPRAARGEPVPRPEPEERLAARLRRAGDRPGAGRPRPARSRRTPRPTRCIAISCCRAIPRFRSSTRSTASATARASPRAGWWRSSTARRSSPCRPRSRSTRRASSTRAEMPEVPGPDELPSEEDEGAACSLQMPEPMRTYYERERPLEIRPVEIKRYTSRDPGEPRFHVWIKRHRAPARRSGDPPVRARLCLRHDAARHLPHPARPHGVRPVDPGRRASTTPCGSTGPSAPTNGCFTPRTRPSAGGARGFSRGLIFKQDGTLVASVAQEGLISRAPHEAVCLKFMQTRPFYSRVPCLFSRQGRSPMARKALACSCVAPRDTRPDQAGFHCGNRRS